MTKKRLISLSKILKHFILPQLTLEKLTIVAHICLICIHYLYMLLILLFVLRVFATQHVKITIAVIIKQFAECL